jgi:hypothetical protein
MITISCDNKKGDKICGNEIEKLTAKHSKAKGKTGVQIGKSHVCSACLAAAFSLEGDGRLDKVFES